MIDRALLGMALVGLGIGVAACGGRGSDEPPRVAVGTAVCEACGMTLSDPRFMAVLVDGQTQRPYDSIECLIRSWRASGENVSDAIWLSDFDTQTLKRQSGLTVVHADYPSPMGGGYAAFADANRARSEARSRQGEFGTLEEAIQSTMERSAP